MKKKEENKNNEAGEPRAQYGSTDGSKTIHFFSSFKEMEEHGHKEMAMHSYSQRMEYLELLRKRIYHDKLSPEGKWYPLKRTIKIITATYR